MAGKKVALRYIRNNSGGHASFRKHSKGLIKKSNDLSSLCNTKVCVLVYAEGAMVPEVFPSHEEAVAILNRYKDVPDMPQFKVEVSQKEFLTQRITKLKQELDRLWCEHEDREIRFLLHKAMLGGNLDDQEVARVVPKFEEILKSLSNHITKTTGKPSVFQPHVPCATRNIDMGPPVMYQVPQQQKEGWVDTRSERTMAPLSPMAKVLVATTASAPAPALASSMKI